MNLQANAASVTDIEEIQHFINGRRVAGASGRFGDVYNPGLGVVAGRVPLAAKAEVETAIAAAAAAFPSWAAVPAARRAQVMFSFRDLVKRHIDELAALVSSEHGKTLEDARGSITRGLEVVEFACGIPQLLKGEFNGKDTIKVTVKKVGGKKQLEFEGLTTKEPEPEPVGAGTSGEGDDTPADEA